MAEIGQRKRGRPTNAQIAARAEAGTLDSSGQSGEQITEKPTGIDFGGAHMYRSLYAFTSGVVVKAMRPVSVGVEYVDKIVSVRCKIRFDDFCMLTVDKAMAERFDVPLEALNKAIHRLPSFGIDFVLLKAPGYVTPQRVIDMAANTPTVAEKKSKRIVRGDRAR